MLREKFLNYLLIKSVLSNNNKLFLYCLSCGADPFLKIYLHKFKKIISAFDVSIYLADCDKVIYILNNFPLVGGNDDYFKNLFSYLKSSKTFLKNSYSNDVSDAALLINILIDNKNFKKTKASYGDIVDSDGYIISDCACLFLNSHINMYDYKSLLLVFEQNNEYVFNYLLSTNYDFTRVLYDGKKIALEYCVKSNNEKIITRVMDQFSKKSLHLQIGSAIVEAVYKKNFLAFSIFINSYVSSYEIKLDNVPLIKYFFKNFNDEIFKKEYSRYLDLLFCKCSALYILENLKISEIDLIIKYGSVINVYHLLENFSSFNANENIVVLFGNSSYVLSVDSLNKILPDGSNLLILAVINQNFDMVKLLVNQGFDVFKKNYEGLSALDYASFLNNMEIFLFLNNKGYSKTKKL